MRNGLAQFQTSSFVLERISEDIKKVISESYAFIESLEDAVKDLYISAGYANHIFKKQTGMSIFTYLVRTRISAAKESLADPYCRINEVAERTGYKSVSQFCSLFKKHTGISPKEFRGSHASRSKALPSRIFERFQEEPDSKSKAMT